MSLTTRDRARLAEVHPALAQLVLTVAQTVPLMVVEGARTLERQRELFRLGKSRTMNSRHLPKAAAGIDYPESHAVDLAPLVDLDGDGVYPVALVQSKNLRRRHLTVSRQAAAVAKTQDWSKAQVVGHPEQSGNVAGLVTVADRAAMSGAGERTQRDADLVAREAPELLDKVIAGEVSAHAAAKQIRAARAQENTVGTEGAPTAEDFDSPPPSADRRNRRIIESAFRH